MFGGFFSAPFYSFSFTPLSDSQGPWGTRETSQIETGQMTKTRSVLPTTKRPNPSKKPHSGITICQGKDNQQLPAEPTTYETNELEIG